MKVKKTLFHATVISVSTFLRNSKVEISQGSGCGSVGRAVASNTREPRFEPHHRQNFIYQIIYQLYKRKDENNEKKAGNGPSLKKVEISLHKTCAGRYGVSIDPLS